MNSTAYLRRCDRCGKWYHPEESRDEPSYCTPRCADKARHEAAWKRLSSSGRLPVTGLDVQMHAAVVDECLAVYEKFRTAVTP